MISCFGLFCLTVQAQSKDTITHNYIKFFSGGNINKTTGTSTYSLNNNLAYTYTKNRFYLNSGVAWLYTTQQKDIINNDFASFANLDFDKKKHGIYYWGLFTFDKSFSLNISYRYQVGGGVGFTIFRQSDSNFISLTDGLLFETSDIINDSLQHERKHTVRNSFRIKYAFALKKFKIDGVHFIQPSLQDFSDYNVQSVSNVTYQINKWLGITVRLLYNKITFNRRENLQFVYGITAEKNF